MKKEDHIFAKMYQTIATLFNLHTEPKQLKAQPGFNRLSVYPAILVKLFT